MISDFNSVGCQLEHLCCGCRQKSFNFNTAIIKGRAHHLAEAQLKMVQRWGTKQTKEEIIKNVDKDLNVTVLNTNKSKRDRRKLEKIQKDLLWEKRDKKQSCFETPDTRAPTILL